MTDTETAPVAPDMATLTLRKPIDFAGQSYASLTFREPTAGDCEAIDGLEGIAADARVISIASGVPEPAIYMLGVRDFRAAAVRAGLFFLDQPTPSLEADPSTQMTLTLRQPISLDGETVEALALREPTAKEWRGWEGMSGTAADIKAVVTISGVREVMVRRVPISELRRAATWIGRFFSDAPPTGAQS